MEISLFLSDNQFIEGVLLAVKEDHIVVDVNQNIYYFALQHIQALSKNAKDFRISSEGVQYVDRNNLADVLEALRYNWVSINSLSNQVLFGVLSKISDNHVTVINNSELLYIYKSYISTINSNLSEEQIVLINKQEQPAVKGFEIEDKITSEHTKKIQEIERVTNIKVPDIPAKGEMEDENSTNEQSQFHQKTRVEMYATLLKLLKNNLLNKDVDKERREDFFEETAIRSFVSHINDKSKGLSDSSDIAVQNCQVEEQVIVEHTQTISETKLIKSLEVPIIEDSAGEGIEIENLIKENSVTTSQTLASEVPDLSRLVKHDLPKEVSEYTFEEDHPSVLGSNNQVSQQEQLPTKPRVKGKEKRLLISAWSTMNNDQHAIVNHENSAMENETPDFKGDPIKKEQPSDAVNSLIRQLHDQYRNEDFVTLEEKLKSAETAIFQLPVIRINPKAEKEMLEKQYYALMKQAETRCFHMSERQLPLPEEEQYLALMKHAAKMYREFKD
nr:YuzF family protein [Sporosarcina sp. E16_8]